MELHFPIFHFPIFPIVIFSFFHVFSRKMSIQFCIAIAFMSLVSLTVLYVNQDFINPFGGKSINSSAVLMVQYPDPPVTSPSSTTLFLKYQQEQQQMHEQFLNDMMNCTHDLKRRLIRLHVDLIWIRDGNDPSRKGLYLSTQFGGYMAVVDDLIDWLSVCVQPIFLKERPVVGSNVSPNDWLMPNQPDHPTPCC